MNFLNSKQSKSQSPLPQNPKFNLQQTLTQFQNHCSDFFHHQFFNAPLKIHVESTLSNLQNHAKHAIETKLGSLSSAKIPIWARIAEVIQLKIDGVAFRLIPESSQIKNAIQERHKAGISEESFAGVPVFQSKSLILRSQNKRYRPVFFRKEDLEKSLLKASRQQKHMNPSLRKGDIQVAVLEDIIHGMKDKSTSDWDDVVFIPPGFDVSADPSQR